MAKKKASKTVTKNVELPQEEEASTKKWQKRPIESYVHNKQQRVNNPPVGLVTPITDPPENPKQRYEYDPHIDPALQFDDQGSEIERRRQPYLNWAGKAERTSFAVPTVSLHVHERIDPKSIIAAVRRSGEWSVASGQKKAFATGHKPLGTFKQRSLFEEPQENPPLRDALDFYRHPHGWSNRLIAGDSLLVMNSLLEKEGMAGKIQMIYLDPPYGICYGSNFQPFVNKREVKDGKDEDLTQEPETIKAFRDTWELGIHSYLTYLRDRLLLAKVLLTESGSVFVQISDENLHHARELMDDVFGSANFMANINYQSMTPLESGHIENVFDYIVWYARDRSRSKYRNLYRPKSVSSPEFRFKDNGNAYRQLDESERSEILTNGETTGIFKRSALESTGFTTTCTFPFEFGGKVFRPRGGKSWRTTQEGMQRLVEQDRLFMLGTKLYFKLYFDDFPYTSLVNSWSDTVGGFAETKRYAVQTHPKIIQRCMLMSTDPGDLVFDPTCGSGTTAFVAENRGRRWITCDTSRVATTLAKQRLMTAVYDYYKLKEPQRGVSGGFLCKTVPHVTLKSIANNPDIREGMTREQIADAIRRHADQETLYDQPEVDRTKARVSGPFTVEAVPAPTVMPVGQSSPYCSPHAPREEPPVSDHVEKKPATKRLNAGSQKVHHAERDDYFDKSLADGQPEKETIQQRELLADGSAGYFSGAW